MSTEDERRFQSSNKCWICNKLFDVGDNKVRDHDHVIGKYRSSAHWSCNINLELTKNVPVIFHNSKGHNSHLIMQEIGKFDVKISVIPNELEKYMAFTINKNLVLTNSMQFMNFSLDPLVKNLPDNDFKYLSQEFTGEQLKLVKQKGVYPYEYIDNSKTFSDKKLPNGCEFYSSLKDECISEKDYLQSVNVWNNLFGKTMDDYHDLYFKTNFLLITEKFINGCLEYYGLVPCHYFSSPRLSSNAMRKMTEIELELISDIDMYLFIEKGMKRGIAYIAKRFSKTNNKYMKSCDNKKPSKYIMYLDANNLYG